MNSGARFRIFNESGLGFVRFGLVREFVEGLAEVRDGIAAPLAEAIVAPSSVAGLVSVEFPRSRGQGLVKRPGPLLSY
jgi:hypothetical protein